MNPISCEDKVVIFCFILQYSYEMYSTYMGYYEHFVKKFTKNVEKCDAISLSATVLAAAVLRHSRISLTQIRLQ